MQSDFPRPTRTSSRAVGFRRAFLRGLGVVLPPLLTIVLLLWAWKTVESYVLRPIESGLRHVIVWNIEETYTSVPDGARKVDPETPLLSGFVFQDRTFVPGPTRRRFLPEEVVKIVDDNTERFGPYAPAPASANAYWHRYVQLVYMPRWVVVPVFLILFATVLYFLGRLFTFNLGRWVVHRFDRTVLRIPLVNKVYGSVKQVTDFAFSEREIEFNRVVAIQYPGKDIWSIGFVTGNSIREIAEATGEEMLSVLMPTSPMPMTGFTVTVRRCDAIDLDLTVDEAIQFVVSCGVVIPPGQRVERLAKAMAAPPHLTSSRAPATSGPPTSGPTASGPAAPSQR